MSELYSTTTHIFSAITNCAQANADTAVGTEGLKKYEETIRRILNTLRARMAAQTRTSKLKKVVKRIGTIQTTSQSLARLHLSEQAGYVVEMSDLNVDWSPSWPPEQEVLRAYLHWLINIHGKMDAKVGAAVTSLELDDVYISLQGDRASAFERKQARALLDEQVHQIALASGSVISEEKLQLIRRQLLMNQPVTMVLEERDNKIAEQAANIQSQSQVALGNDTNNKSNTEIPDAQKDDGGVDVKTAFRTHPWLVILGNPGGGKTTVCRFLAFSLAKEYLSKVADAEGSTTGSRVYHVLPIMLRVSEYSRHLNEYPDLLDFLGHSTWQERRPFINGYPISPEILQCLFLRHIQIGKVGLMLDGLDEITEAAQRAAVVRAVDAFAINWIRLPGTGPIGNQVVVTSRIAGYHSAPLENSAFMHFTICPLKFSAIEQFCKTWIRAIYKAEYGGAVKEVEAASEAEALISSIKDPLRSGLRELSSSPLLLSALCSMYHSRGSSLPEKRVQIYEYFVNQLIEVWKTKSSSSAQLFAPEKMIPILCSVARRIHENSSTGLIEADDVRQEFACELAKLQPTVIQKEITSQVDQWLKVAREEVGILAAHGEDLYGFVHLTFQEYLAALAIMREPNAVDLILDRLADPRWREPLLLAIGYASFKWTQEDFNVFLRRLLQAENTNLIARGVVLLSMALKEMVRLPNDDVVKDALMIVLQSAVNSLDTEGHHVFLDVATQLFHNADGSKLLTHVMAVAMQIDSKDLRNLPLAAFCSKLDIQSQRLVELLFPCLALDTKEWNWPIRRFILKHPKDVLLHAIPEDKLLFRKFLMSNNNIFEELIKNSTLMRLVLVIYGGFSSTTTSKTTFSLSHIINDSFLTPVILDWLQLSKSKSKHPNTLNDLSSLSTIVTSVLQRTLMSKHPELDFICDSLLALLVLNDLSAIHPYLEHPVVNKVYPLMVAKLKLAQQWLHNVQAEYAESIFTYINAKEDEAESDTNRPYVYTAFMRALNVAKDPLYLEVGDVHKQPAFLFACTLHQILLVRPVEDIAYNACVMVDVALDKFSPIPRGKSVLNVQVEEAVVSDSPDRTAISKELFYKMISETLNVWVTELGIADLRYIPLALEHEQFCFADALLLTLILPDSLGAVKFALRRILVILCQVHEHDWAPIISTAALVHNPQSWERKESQASQAIHLRDLGTKIKSITNPFVKCFGLYVLAEAHSATARVELVREAVQYALSLAPINMIYMLNILLPLVSSEDDNLRQQIVNKAISLATKLGSPENIIRLCTSMFPSINEKTARRKCAKIILNALKKTDSKLDMLTLALSLKICQPVMALDATLFSGWNKHLARLNDQKFYVGIALGLNGMQFVGAMELKGSTGHVWPYNKFLEVSTPFQQAITTSLSIIYDALFNLAMVPQSYQQPPWHRVLRNDGRVNDFTVNCLLLLAQDEPLQCSAEAAGTIDSMLNSKDIETRDSAIRLLKVTRHPSPSAMPLIEKWMRHSCQGRYLDKQLLLLASLLSLESGVLCTLSVEACEVLFDALGSAEDLMRLRFEAATKLHRKVSRLSSTTFLFIAKLRHSQHKNPVPPLLFGWLTEGTMMDDANAMTDFLSEVTQGKPTCIRTIKLVESDLWLRAVGSLLGEKDTLSESHWNAFFVFLFQSCHTKPEIRVKYSIWVATLARMFLKLPERHKAKKTTNSALEARADSDPTGTLYLPPTAEEDPQEEEPYRSEINQNSWPQQLQKLSENVAPEFQACMMWAVGHKDYSYTRHEFWIEILQAAKVLRIKRWPNIALGTALLWCMNHASGRKDELLLLVAPFIVHESHVVRQGAAAAIVEAIYSQGVESQKLMTLTADYNVSVEDLLVGGLHLISRNVLFWDSVDGVNSFLVNLIEKYEELLPVYWKLAFDGLQDYLIRSTEVVELNPRERLLYCSITLDNKAPHMAISLADTLFTKMPAACNMSIKATCDGKKLHHLLSRAALVHSFPIRCTIVRILSYLDDLYQVDIAKVVAAASMDVIYVRTAAFEAVKRLRSVPVQLCESLEKLLVHPSTTTAYYAGTCLQTIATNKRCPTSQRQAIMVSFEKAIEKFAVVSEQLIVYNEQAKFKGKLKSLVFQMLLQTATNLTTSLPAKIALYSHQRLCHLSGPSMKKVMLDCMFWGETVAPFAFYFGEPICDFHPMLFQALWLLEERGGRVPQEVIDRVSELLAQALRNRLPFGEFLALEW